MIEVAEAIVALARAGAVRPKVAALKTVDRKRDAVVRVVLAQRVGVLKDAVLETVALQLVAVPEVLIAKVVAQKDVAQKDVIVAPRGAALKHAVKAGVVLVAPAVRHR